MLAARTLSSTISRTFGAPGAAGGRWDQARRSAVASRTDQTAINKIKSGFTSNGYKLKQVFAQSAAACPGQ